MIIMVIIMTRVLPMHDDHGDGMKDDVSDDSGCDDGEYIQLVFKFLRWRELCSQQRPPSALPRPCS